MHTISIQIVYAWPNKVWSKCLELRRGATPIDVIELSGILDEFPNMQLSEMQYGVYSKRVDQHYLMAEGDRLEIYRPLTADPKTIRRELAKVGKTMSGER